MIPLLTESLLTPSVWLWLGATAVAIMLLAGGANRRHVGLVESLKEFVRKINGDPADKPGENDNPGEASKTDDAS